MDPKIASMFIVTIGFSWPVVLAFAGAVSSFYVFMGTAVVGIAYFAVVAGLGHATVGTISLVPALILVVCGVMNAHGIREYIPLLATPQYAGGALAMVNMAIVYGTTAVNHFFHGIPSELSHTNIAGGVVVAIGTMMLTWK